jgi:hypothetical protein
MFHERDCKPSYYHIPTTKKMKKFTNITLSLFFHSPQIETVALNAKRNIHQPHIKKQLANCASPS